MEQSQTSKRKRPSKGKKENKQSDKEEKGKKAARAKKEEEEEEEHQVNFQNLFLILISCFHLLDKFLSDCSSPDHPRKHVLLSCIQQ